MPKTPRFLKKATERATLYHSRVPLLQKLPLNAVAIILLLLLVQCVVWAVVGVVLVRGPLPDHVLLCPSASV